MLRTGALAALALPLAGCDLGATGYSTGPDPLLPLLARAEADARAAGALAESAPRHAQLAQQVVAVRTAHADALRAEIERQNSPRPERAAGGDPGAVADLAALGQRLTEAREEALGLVPAVPRYRAGLVGSVAAGCAGVQQLARELGAGQPGALGPVSTGPLPPEAVNALRQALAAEHAAVWVYGLVSAFLPAAYDRGVTEGAAAHRDRRDACERVLDAAGAESVPAEPAYLTPEPVTDEASATAVVATAEADAALAWRGVLERTDDEGLRTMAAGALVGSATRGTSWRAEAGREPAAVPLPGTP
ncbi:ferritin-like domain-containing protein [Amycolatopsis arida]|uniref:ferritin-like domain-containing protein n=1 Tax=Amycolatopsis arida TaxID=587909 RepID=UPI001FBA00D4|nr:ferritin-like domain-containing protein [Amycolatopsis arida]